MPNRLARVRHLERVRGSPCRFFSSTFDDLDGEALDAAIQKERERLGIGEDDVHFVTVYEHPPADRHAGSRED